MVFEAVLEERQQDEGGVLPLRGESVGDLAAAGASFDPSLHLELPEAAGEGSRSEAGVVPPELAEPTELEERQVTALSEAVSNAAGFPDAFERACRELDPLKRFLARSIDVPW